MNAINLRRAVREEMLRKVAHNNRRRGCGSVYTGVEWVVYAEQLPMAADQEGYYWVLSDDQSFKTGGKAYGWP